MTFNDNKINLPRVVITKLQDEFKIRCLMNGEPTLPHNAEIRNYIVYFGSRHSRECINKLRKYINSM